MDSLIFAHVYHDEGVAVIPIINGGLVHEAFLTEDKLLVMALLEKKGVPVSTRDLVIEITPNQYNLH